MKLLHTSDWHLDARLEHYPRWEEHERFLTWLRETVAARDADALVVAGDIFDSATPSLRSLRQYFNFLRGVFEDFLSGKNRCRNVVATGGNHDSAALLETSRSVLEILNVHVVATPTSDPRGMLFPLEDAEGRVGCILAAVPFLHDRYVRRYVSGETPEERTAALLRGIRDHYRTVTDAALQLRRELGPRAASARICATGHLFTAGGTPSGDVSERRIHELGTLERFPASDFPPELDYVALGHLHLAQRVAGRENVRYSGAPLVIGLNETRRQKVVLEVEFPDPEVEGVPGAEAQPGHGLPVEVVEIPVPEFRKIVLVRGNREEVTARVRELRDAGEPVWVKVVCLLEYRDFQLVSELVRECEGTCVSLLKVETRLTGTSDAPEGVQAARKPPRAPLMTLRETEVFERFLDGKGNFSPETRRELVATFAEALGMLDTDPEPDPDTDPTPDTDTREAGGVS